MLVRERQDVTIPQIARTRDPIQRLLFYSTALNHDKCLALSGKYTEHLRLRRSKPLYPVPNPNLNTGHLQGTEASTSKPHPVH